MGKEQGYIYMGFTCNPEETEEPALALMAQILSARMAFEIRERQGLAYSIGARVTLRPEGAWLVDSMATRPDNIQVAIVKGIDK